MSDDCSTGRCRRANAMSFAPSDVGNLGRHLLRQPNINQIPLAINAANIALPAAQRLPNPALVPFRGYSNITSANNTLSTPIDLGGVNITSGAGTFPAGNFFDNSPEHRLWRIKGLLNDVQLHPASLESYPSLFRVLTQIKPDEVNPIDPVAMITASVPY